MDCSEIKERILTDYYDGELPSHEAQELLAHLKGCASCSHFEKSASLQLHSKLGIIREIKPSPRVWKGISETIKMEGMPQPGWKYWNAILKYPKSVFAGLVAVSIIVILYSSIPSPKLDTSSDDAEKCLEEQAEFIDSLEPNSDLNGFDHPIMSNDFSGQGLVK